MSGSLVQEQTQQQVLDVLFEQDDVSWRTILYDLVKTEQMDPWDVDLTKITHKYLETIRSMQEHDLKVSGKVLLAAALLLKIKSTHFIDKDLAEFDLLLSGEEYNEDELWVEGGEPGARDRQKFKLIPRNPQPRTRKVSIHDLIQALQKAMETKKRILSQQRPVKFVMPRKGIDIVEVIYDLYHKISYYTQKNKGQEKSDRITFTQLLPPRAGKQEKAYTFIPLLHLESLQRIETEQIKPFEEIYIQLKNKEKNPGKNLA